MLKIDEPETTSGYHMIQPNKNKSPFTVFCNMTAKNGTGVTTFSHDSEQGRRKIDNWGDQYSYIRVHRL